MEERAQLNDVLLILGLCEPMGEDDAGAGLAVPVNGDGRGQRRAIEALILAELKWRFVLLESRTRQSNTQKVRVVRDLLDLSHYLSHPRRFLCNQRRGMKGQDEKDRER